ncbi:AraC family transcriptional regulator [Agrobacterium vitis]|nr:AraC family transcriptional regulator [Agrobacterium vitis]NSY10823.1 AraC family transcriptional regulator [Agrobacterium vitis]
MPFVGRSVKRGRPEHVASPENVNKIKMMLSLGWSNERISNVLGISQPTLRKNYLQVLKLERSIARDQMVVAQVMKAMELISSGNVGAFKALDRLVERNDAMVADRAFRGEEPATPVQPERLGKKELAQRAAEDAESNDTWGGDLAFRGRPN